MHLLQPHLSLHMQTLFVFFNSRCSQFFDLLSQSTVFKVENLVCCIVIVCRCLFPLDNNFFEGRNRIILLIVSPALAACLVHCVFQ